MLAVGSASAQTSTNAHAPRTAKTAAADTAGKKVAIKKHVIHHRKPQAVKAVEQSETITLENDNDKNVVEIVNGGVYVNGELVSTINNTRKEDHKIVIDREGNIKKHSAADNDTVSMMDEAPRHKPLLGVFTDDNGENDGARIRSVIHGSPADEAGLQTGDIVIKLGGMDVHNAADLVNAVNDHDWGETVTIVYTREGHREVTRADLGDAKTYRVPEDDEYGGVPDRDGSMTLPDPFMDNYRKEYHTSKESNDYYYEYTLTMGIVGKNEDNGKGVEITEVKPNSPAADAGLMKGDIITWIDHQRTRNVDDIHMVLSYSWPNERMKVVVKRDGEMMVTHMYLSKQTVKKNL